MKTKVTENNNNIPATEIVRVFNDFRDALGYLDLIYDMISDSGCIINIEFIEENEEK